MTVEEVSNQFESDASRVNEIRLSHTSIVRLVDDACMIRLSYW